MPTMLRETPTRGETMSDERYTVRMLDHRYPGRHDINGVCVLVRDALRRGIIPVIEIDTDREAELEERQEIAQELRDDD